MRDYRVPVEFTAILVIPENHGDPAFASISDQDVRVWVGELTFDELIDRDSKLNPLHSTGQLDPGLYRAKCSTICRYDDVFINILEVTKQ